MLKISLIFILFGMSLSALAEPMQMDHSMPMTSAQTMEPADCGEMMAWDRTTNMCLGLPMSDMPMGMWMLHGNGFVVQDFEEGARGRSRLSAPNMIMADVGRSFGDHYLNVDLMMTFEKWTFAKDGYPELLQIGEKNENDEPFIDSQHPHSSPIMGLTFSDTVRLGDNKDYLKIFFAPRGQATEGPIAFMHRATGMVNPDAPLGHHIGQDVSHITSTVLGASLALGRWGVEGSVFNGTEPEPTKVDLPLGALNSSAVRLIYQFSDETMAMISAAEVKDPEPTQPDLKKIWRYSGSMYSKFSFENGWKLDNTIIYGLINNYDQVSKLTSVNEEFWFHQKDLPHNYWGRIELVDRTAGELGIVSLNNTNDPEVVTAVTAGYTYKMNCMESLEMGVGASITKDLLPTDFKSAYGADPLSGKIFLQVSGMKMGSD